MPKKATNLPPVGTILEKQYKSGYVEYTLILPNGGELTASKRETLEWIRDLQLTRFDY